MSKIVDVIFEQKVYEYYEPFHITNSISTSSNNVEVKVVLDSGSIGYGESSPSFRVNGERFETLVHIQNFIKNSIKGLDVKNYRRIFYIIDALKAFPSVKAAVQFAVLDALSEEINVPVYQILGGAKDEIETDKTVSIGTLDEMVKDAKLIYEEGFRIIKIKVGENLNEDIEKMIAISENTKGARYIVDANTGYTPKEAVQFAHALYKYGIDVVILEQPVAMTDLEGLKFVRFNSLYPVAADEAAHTKYDALKLIKEEAIDFINIKLMKSGISDALAIVEMAKTANIGLMIGCMGESSVGINQSVHFAAGTGTFAYHDLDSHMLMKENEFRGKFRQEGAKIILK